MISKNPGMKELSNTVIIEASNVYCCHVDGQCGMILKSLVRIARGNIRKFFSWFRIFYPRSRQALPLTKIDFQQRLSMMKIPYPFVLSLLICWAASACAQEPDLDPSIAKWEKDIVKLEELNIAQPNAEQSILFYGSSSIRRWATIADDMAPWPAIRRGYGGAKLPDVIHYAPRIVGPHIGLENPNRCRSIVLFVANDITGKKNDATPSEVANRFTRLHEWIRQQDPTIPVFWIEVTPTQKRWAQWPKIAEATKRIGQIANADENTHLIATAGAYLGVDGRPRAELFVKDRLHLSESGYQFWASLIKAQLHSKLGAAKPWEKPTSEIDNPNGSAAPDEPAQPAPPSAN